MARERVMIGDLILLEVLQGARDQAHAAAIERQMRVFPIVALLGASAASRAAANYRRLRSVGVTARMADLIIATYCIEHRLALLHEDRDFEPMSRHLGLEVA